jgi:hypothetical protein
MQVAVPLSRSPVLSSQSPERSRKRCVVANITGKDHDRQIRVARVVVGAAHDRAAGQDLAEHARRSQREAFGKYVVGGDAAFADEKSQRRR